MTENIIVVGCGMQCYYDTGMQDFWSYHIVTKIDTESNVVHMVDFSNKTVCTRSLIGLLDQPVPKFPGSNFPKTPYEEWKILSEKEFKDKITQYPWVQDILHKETINVKDLSHIIMHTWRIPKTKINTLKYGKKISVLIDTTYVHLGNIWKLSATLSAERYNYLLEKVIENNSMLTNTIIEEAYRHCYQHYLLSYSGDVLFIGISELTINQFGPMVTPLTSLMALQKYGIDAMEEAQEKTYCKIVKVGTMNIDEKIKNLESELHDLRIMHKEQSQDEVMKELAGVDKELKLINHTRDILVKKYQSFCKHTSKTMISSYTGKYDFCDVYKCNSCGYQWSVS